MPRAITDKIQTVEDFHALLETLRLDLAEANEHYLMHLHLVGAKEGTYTKALSQSQTFWFLTYRAHFDAAISRLCRAYDQNDGALSLRTFLETIRSKPAYLPTPLEKGWDAHLDAQLDFVSHETNTKVKNLMMWRHKVLAHRDVGMTISRTMASAHPVTHDDLSALLDTGFDLVNRYGVAFFGSSLQRDMVGSRDYLKVLETLQDSVSALEAEHRAEMTRLRSAD